MDSENRNNINLWLPSSLCTRLLQTSLSCHWSCQLLLQRNLNLIRIISNFTLVFYSHYYFYYLTLHLHSLYWFSCLITISSFTKKRLVRRRSIKYQISSFVIRGDLMIGTGCVRYICIGLWCQCPSWQQFAHIITVLLPWDSGTLLDPWTIIWGVESGAGKGWCLMWLAKRQWGSNRKWNLNQSIKITFITI